MTNFSLKEYQIGTLDALKAYLQEVLKQGDANTAFYKITKRPYYELEQLKDLPYICLRIPTGGGKTIIGAHSVATICDNYLYPSNDNPVVLWLVPSNPILSQTLASLRNRNHPNRQALAQKFGENVRIMDVSEALYAKRADYDGGAVVIVATIQSFRVDNTEGRKVYEANGELMDSFNTLDPQIAAIMEKGQAGEIVPSLANVIRSHRPIVIIDEAHNARTDLSFDVLARLAPSIILELTATPITPSEHKPEKGKYASNVLHSVSAAELKVADMIKLPVILRGNSDPNNTIADAINKLDELQAHAVTEETKTNEFVRPIMLLQAEAKSKDKETLHAEELKKKLMVDFAIPENQIAIATGDTKGIEGIDLFARDCAIRFIITQSALREGWDCSFAYVLCSVAEQKASRAVEQLLGRVLRMPNARRKQDELLNQAYAFATTNHFLDAANALKDGMVQNGFERIEAQNLVKTPDPKFDGFDAAIIFVEKLPEGTDYNDVAAKISVALGNHISIDPDKGTITAHRPLTNYDKTNLELALPNIAKATIATLVLKSQGARLNEKPAIVESIHFAVPRLGVYTQYGLELFKSDHYLSTPWDIEKYDANEILKYFAQPNDKADEAIVDIDASQKVTISFADELHKQMLLGTFSDEWTMPRLANWLDRKIPINSRKDILRTSSIAFIRLVIEVLENKLKMGFDDIVRARFKLARAIEETLKSLRDTREKQSFKLALDGTLGFEVKTNSELELVFVESKYSYSQPYKGTYQFKKHFFQVIGDLDDKGEEFECAVFLDKNPKVKKWIRNTAKQPNSFWLQYCDGKFYPDFVALLEDGRVLVIEYKGSHLVTAEEAKNKDLIGKIWADTSAGKCLFIMVEEKQFSLIEQLIG